MNGAPAPQSLFGKIRLRGPVSVPSLPMPKSDTRQEFSKGAVPVRVQSRRMEGSLRLPRRVGESPAPAVPGGQMAPQAPSATGNETASSPPAPQPTPGSPPGKTSISKEEAVRLLGLLDAATGPVDEAMLESQPDECVRDLASGPYPLALKTRDEIADALSKAETQQFSLSLSMGQLNAIERTALCAEALGKVSTETVVVTVGAGVGAAALLYLLLL